MSEPVTGNGTKDDPWVLRTRPSAPRSSSGTLPRARSTLEDIYTKLGARDRSSAIRRARELRLLSTGHS